MKMVGMAKGAGMIAPNMATMLAVILTDVRADPSFLKEALIQAAGGSFNSITIDGDTSTNDTVVVMAGGSPDSPKLPDRSDDQEMFSEVLSDACRDLARQIVKDGEGATKVVSVRVSGAPDRKSAARVARTIAESPLVKTAFHGEDPNWGRIVCAAGRAGVAFDPNQVDLFIGDVQIVSRGNMVSDDWETPAHEVMKSEEFSVSLNLKAGDSEAELLTTDLSREYVSINADYRS
jgi:glutamate N-acetyltransferase/amino-acid N-acetyltransferase